jgi:hypothetical protein
MSPIEDPPGFIVRAEAQKAAWDNGYRLERGATGGWLGYGSTTAKGDIWLAATSHAGPWFIALSHPGVAAELAGAATAIAGQGVARFIYPSLAELYPALERLYRLAVSLPDNPLVEFRRRTAHLPRTTETERLVVQRVGQNLFREALLEYWNHRCPMTGISEPALLRASHIVPWAECDDDAHRLDVHNGLLLSALWDAAFDAGLVSFSDDGRILIHARLNETDRTKLLVGATPSLSRLTRGHQANLARHRRRFDLEQL